MMKLGEVEIVAGETIKIECAVDGSWVTLYDERGKQKTIDRYGPLNSNDGLVRCIFRAVPAETWQTGSGWDTAMVDGDALLRALELYEFDFNSIPEIAADIGWADSETVAA